MEEKDWIFAKWPNWLRWTLALPTSIIGGLILYIIIFIGMKLSGIIMGYSTDGLLYLTIQNILMFGAFLYVMYLIVPKWKLFVIGIFSGLFAIFFIAVEAMLFYTGKYFALEDLIVIVVVIVLLAFSVYAFMNCKEDEGNNVAD